PGGGTGAIAAPVGPARGGRWGAGGFLLVVGALLLVMAGVAFLAFAWDRLGPLGQVAVLFTVGGLAIAAAVRLVERLPSTAATLGVGGVLLVLSSSVATRTLGEDMLGAAGSLAAAVLAALVLTAVGMRLRRRIPAVAELPAVGGA